MPVSRTPRAPRASFDEGMLTPRTPLWSSRSNSSACALDIVQGRQLMINRRITLKAMVNDESLGELDADLLNCPVSSPMRSPSTNKSIELPTVFKRLSSFINNEKFRGDVLGIRFKRTLATILGILSLICSSLMMFTVIYGWYNAKEAEAGFSLSLVYNILTIVFCLHGFVGVYYVAQIHKRFNQFLTGWSKICYECSWDENARGPNLVWEEIDKWSKAALAYTIIGPCLLASVFYMGRTDIVFNWKGLGQKSIAYFDVARPAEFVIFFFTTLPNYYCQAIFAILCVVCYLEFCLFQDRFAQAAQTYTLNSAEKLCEFRDYHFRLIKLVHHVDETMSYYAAWVFFINLPCLCLLLYAVLVHADAMYKDQMTIGILGMFVAIHLMVICLFPSLVSFKAQNCLGILEDICSRTDDNYLTNAMEQTLSLAFSVMLPGAVEKSHTVETDMQCNVEMLPAIEEETELANMKATFVDPDMRNKYDSTYTNYNYRNGGWDNEPVTPHGNKWLTNHVYEQLVLFIQQVNSMVIGISCGGFFIITKEVLLTLGSIMITYFILIMQLHQSAGHGCKCNCPMPS